MKGKGETEKKDDYRLPGTCWPKFRSVYLILSPLPDNGPGAAVMVIGYVLCVCGPVHQGGAIFERKNWALGKLCQIVEGHQIQHFSLKCCLITWHKASENLDCCPEMGNKKYFKFVKVLTEAKFVPLFLKAKIKRKSKKYFTVFFNQKLFAHFWKKKKNFTNFNFEFNFQRLFFEVKGRNLKIFTKNIHF